MFVCVFVCVCVGNMLSCSLWICFVFSIVLLYAFPPPFSVLFTCDIPHPLPHLFNHSSPVRVLLHFKSFHVNNKYRRVVLFSPFLLTISSSPPLILALPFTPSTSRTGVFLSFPKHPQISISLPFHGGISITSYSTTFTFTS